MTRAPRRLLRDTRGANYVEYIILLGLVALLALGAFRMFGSSVSAKAEEQAARVANLEGAGTAPPAVSPSQPNQAPPASPPKKEGKSFWSRVGDFGKGFVGGAVDTVTGLWHVVTHPVETVKGIGYAVSHPVDTYHAMKDAVVSAWNENPDEFMGRAVFEVASAFGPGAFTKASKLKNVAAAEKLAAAATVAKQGDKVADATKLAIEADKAADAAKIAAAADKASDGAKFMPKGIGKAALSTPEGQQLLRELKKADPAASADKITARAHQMLDSGKALPVVRTAKPGEKLYKIVPEGSPPSSHTPFWMPKSQLDDLMKNPGSLADEMGLPNESLSPTGRYKIYEIEPSPGKTPKIFESEVGPTQQGATYHPGGGKQTIVPSRADWTAPVDIGAFPP